MFGTEKSTRAAPARRFENYVLTRAVDPSVGLSSIDDKQFTRITAASEIADGDGTYVIIPIGFDYHLDGITYNKIAVDPNGWAALVDPVTGTFTEAEVMTGSTEENPLIRSTFTSNAVLLAPWFDDLRNVLSDVSHLTTPPWNYSYEKIDRISKGIEPPPPWWNPSAYGTSYYNDVRSYKGRRLIVRWNVIANAFGTTAEVIKFELVLYENGTIEFRYAPRTVSHRALPLGYQNEAATVGIFMPGGANRFRDFSIGLGYLDDRRPMYMYGGAINTAFTDDGSGAQNDGSTGTKYVHNLWVALNWPASNSAGCIMTFAPPVNKRKVLPRKVLRERDAINNLPIVARTGYGTPERRSFQGFDDRKTPTYAISGSSDGVIVNFPSTLPRFFGGASTETTDRQDIFAGDFTFTASIVKNSAEPFINTPRFESIAPFNETNLYEQVDTDSASTDDVTFFQTGSVVELFGSFDSGLKSKTQVKFSLPVDYNIMMPDVTSSIYYYNSKTHSWNVPTNSTYSLTSGSTTPDAGSKGDWSNPASWHGLGMFSNGYLINEDARGFGPYGNVVSSGSHHPSGSGLNSYGDQTDYELMKVYDQKKVTTALGKEWPKSTRVNPEYQPTPDETFVLNITEPMLIEKAVFEIPMTAGPGWFSDMTQCWRPLSIGSIYNRAWGFQMAGPAMTVALYKRVQHGKSSSRQVVSSSLDLIMTGTIIPAGDNVSRVTIQQSGVTDFFIAGNHWTLTPRGFLAAGDPAGAVVYPDASNYFTGSAKVKSMALNSVGPMLIHNGEIFYSGVPGMTEDVYKLLQDTPTFDLNVGGAGVGGLPYIAAVAPFGRASTGLVPSGRSALGRESSTLQRKFDPGGKFVRNPYYIGPGALSTAEYADVSGTLGFIEHEITVDMKIPTLEFIAPVSLISHSPCPYLVMPGDELVLSISKMHPFIEDAMTLVPNFSGSQMPHDVGLITGSINITLFGSKMRAGVEFNDASSQRVGSDALHEIIGNEPVLDQFNMAYASEFSGSMITDRFNLEKTIPYLYYGVRGNRGSQFTSSYSSTRYYGHMSVRGNEDRLPISQQLFWTKRRRIFEFKKRSRTFSMTSDTETFWDSRIPDATSVMEFISPRGSLVAGSGPTGGLIGDYVIFTGRAGDMTYCGVPFPVGASTYNQFGLHDWIMTYPYESKYKNITSTFADKMVDGKLWSTAYLSGGGSISPPGGFTHPLGGLTIEFGQTSGSVGSGGGVNRYNGLPPTRGWAGEGSGGSNAGIGLPEFIKFFYGFGNGRSNIDNGHVKFLGYEDLNGLQTGVELRGWRHGMISAFPLKTSAVFSRTHFGHMRDMFEQRLDTKFFSTARVPSGEVLLGPVQVRFLDRDGKNTDPYKTLSSNMSSEVTSSLPYFDGVARNRPDSYANANAAVVVI
jgi:hypothetical protein